MPPRGLKRKRLRRRMAKVFRQRYGPRKTGIVLKPKYVRFLIGTLKDKLLSELQVDITASEVRPDGGQEIILVCKGTKPNYDEAQVLIQNSVNMTKAGWDTVYVTRSINNTKAQNTSVVEVEDDSLIEDKVPITAEENSKGNDGSEHSKESSQASSTKQVVCDGAPKDGICPVVIDTEGGGNFRLSKERTVYYNNKIPIIRVSNIETSGSEVNIDSSQQSLNQEVAIVTSSKSSSSKSSAEDMIPLDSRKSNKKRKSVRKSRDPGNETITVGDDTILISSESESEDDIKIEKVVSVQSDGDVLHGHEGKKQKRKQLSRIVTGPAPIVLQPLTVNGKRKSEESANPAQRSKICKQVRSSDVSSKCNDTFKVTFQAWPTAPLGVNSLYVNGGKKQAARACLQQPKKVQQHVSTNINSQPSTSTKYNFDGNVIRSSESCENKTGLRPVIIDGNNVGREGKEFNFKKVETCIKYFQNKNHKVLAFLPRHMQGVVREEPDRSNLFKLEADKVLCFTPSRKMPDGRHYAAYDDRFIVQTATELDGIIVSNDNFRDIIKENERWKETVENRLLMFTWVQDMLMFPNDPLGRDGPHLEDFLRFPNKE